MDLKQLRYFVAIVESGSLTAAARTLHIAQPALSHHLKKLESEFGKRLLSRDAHGVQTTREGDLLYRHAVGVLRQSERLAATMLRSTDQPEGNVAIGLPITTSALLSLPLFERARTRYPAVALELVDGHSRELGRSVLEGRLDMALMMPPGPPHGAHEQQQLVEGIVVVCPAQAPWLPPGDTLTMAQLSALPLLMSSRRERLYAMLESVTGNRRPGLNIRGHIDQLGSLLKAVAAGYGVTMLPWCAVANTEVVADLRFRTIEGVRLERQLLLCRAAAVHLSDAAIAIGQLLEELLCELVNQGRWRGARLQAIDWPLFATPA